MQQNATYQRVLTFTCEGENFVFWQSPNLDLANYLIVLEQNAKLRSADFFAAMSSNLFG
jgi:hypothetical protein